MGLGDPGKEEFADAIMAFRNQHIAAAMAPLMLMRVELLTNDELSDRGGISDVTVNFFIAHLQNCDKWRRRITYNPDGSDIGAKIATAIDANAKITDSANPFGGDDIQMASGRLFKLPWALDGSDPDIPLSSQVKLTSTNALILLGAIDQAIVAWTRLNSRDRTRFITKQDSMRIYGQYQQILAFLQTFGGEANRVDVAQVLPSQEPTGPANSTNAVTEAPASPNSPTTTSTK